MAKTEEGIEVTIVDPDLSLAIRRYHGVKVAKRNLEKTEKELKTAVVLALQPYMEEFDATAYNFDGAVVKPSQRPGSSIVNANKLLEQGVDPEVVGRATSATPYVQYDTEIRED